MISYYILSCTLKNSFTHRAFLNQVSITKRINKFSSMCHCSMLRFRFLKLTSNLTIKNKKDVCRYKSSESGPPSNKLPPLMEFRKIMWPSLIKSFRNFILATFIIKPYFDQDFNLQDFVFGSKRAVEVVSKKISEGDINSLSGLVTSDILPSIQRAISLMSLSQREQLAIRGDDIYFSFPYQVGVMFNEENDQKRFVEITMVFHALRGLSLMRDRGEEPPLNMGMLPEYQNRISVCNYRFIKEFTKGVDSDWTINLLNHFKPVDEVQE